jgi:hypothetical protein
MFLVHFGGQIFPDLANHEYGFWKINGRWKDGVDSSWLHVLLTYPQDFEHFLTFWIHKIQKMLLVHLLLLLSQPWNSLSF